MFDKYGNLLFEKWLRGESAFCDISTDGTLVASVVHGEKVGDPDTAVVWDIEGNEVFSYQVPYKENPALYVQPEEGHGEGVFSKLGDLEISNDGKLLLMATDEGYVSVVRLSDKKILCDFFGNAKMYKLFWSADDKVVYTGTEAGDFRATEVATGKMLWKKYIEGTIFGWAMNDTCVVTSTKSTGVGYLICTELATGKTLWTLDVGMRCSSMTLSHGSRTLASERVARRIASRIEAQDMANPSGRGESELGHGPVGPCGVLGGRQVCRHTQRRQPDAVDDNRRASVRRAYRARR